MDLLLELSLLLLQYFPDFIGSDSLVQHALDFLQRQAREFFKARMRLSRGNWSRE